MNLDNVNTKSIHCKACAGEIECKDDLVVVTNIFSIVAYHESCYGNKLKSADRIFLGEPINSNVFILKAIITWIMFVVLFFIGCPGKYIFLFLPIILTGYRVYSWYKYERYL